MQQGGIAAGHTANKQQQADQQSAQQDELRFCEQQINNGILTLIAGAVSLRAGFQSLAGFFPQNRLLIVQRLQYDSAIFRRNAERDCGARVEKPFQIKLIIRRLPANAAIGWIKQAWEIFKQYPLVFIQMVLLTFVFTFLAAQFTLTYILAIFVSPFLTAGLYGAIVGVQQQQKIDIMWLFKPFQQAFCRQVLIMIAALNFLLSVPLLRFREHLHIAMVNAQQSGEQEPLLLLQMILLVAGLLITTMLFAYAVAIAYFLKEQRVLLILQASFLACWRNIPALLLFGLLSLGLLLLTVPTMLLGLIVVVPLLNIAFFLSFNELFALKLAAGKDAVLEV